MHPGCITNGKRLSRSVHFAAEQVIEQLEARQLLSVTQNTAGWSVITQDSGGNKIYVSNSQGNDTWDGTTPTHIDGTNHGPVKKISTGRGLIQDGKDDWLLLKRGDSWNEVIGPWNKHGPSASDPMLISYYGFYDDGFGDLTYFDQSSFPDDSQSLNLDPRPIINSGLSDGIQFTTGAGNIAVVGIQFFPRNTSDSTKTYDGTNSTGVTGIRAQVTGHDFLVEDCLFDGFKDDIVIGNPDTPITNFTLRRSMVLDAYNHAGAHAQGLYASGTTTNLTIEQNVFDHNGWKVATDKTVFNHDMYINTGAVGTVVRGNVVTRGSLRGTLLRAGGDVYDNFYDQNAVAIQVGNSSSNVLRNVILEGVDLPSLASGVGIDVAFSIPSVHVQDNIVAHDQSAYTYNLSGINLNGGTHLATVTGNIVYDWRRTLIAGVSGSGNTIQQNVLEDFDGYHPLVNFSGSGDATFGNNSYYEPSSSAGTAFQDGSSKMGFSAWTNSSHFPSDSSSSFGTLEPYVDPNRDMGTYNATLGQPGTFTDWIGAQRAQTREGSTLFSPWYQPKFDGTPADYTAAAEIKHIKDGFSTSTNNQTAQVVNITATDPNASELGLDPGTFSVTRTGTALQLSLPLTVNFDLSGSAVLNSDYTLNHTTITFPVAPVGATSQTLDPPIIVTPKADAIIEGDESVKINIRGDTSLIPRYVTGLNPTATVTISDATTTVNVVATTSNAFEEGQVPGVFSLSRSGATTSALTVNVLWSGEATYGVDYNVTSNPDGKFQPPDVNGNGTVTFDVGVSTVDIIITPVDDGIMEGVDPITGDPAPGQEDVGLTVLTGTSYSPGVLSGGTVTIVDPDSVAPPPSDGGGGLVNPPPLGHGLAEDYINNQDNFVPDSVISSLHEVTTVPNSTPPVVGAVDTIHDQIEQNVYGQVVFSQQDGRPGFDEPNHPGVNKDHFSTIWTGQIQPSYDDVYTLYMTVDGDASARLWIQNDRGNWFLVTSTNDTDPTKTDYTNSNYFTHRIADANDDANVDTTDFTTMAQNFGKTGQTWSNGDFNGDGVINALDFNAISTNYGTDDQRPDKHTVSGDVSFFEAGGRYSVVIEYSDKVNRAYLRLFWGSASQAKQEVPLERMYQSTVATGPALDGAITGSSLFSSTSIDPTKVDPVLG